MLNGETTVYSLEYPCHSPTEKRWFLMTVTPYTVDQACAVVSHLNITDRKLAELRQTSFDHILERSLNEIFVFDAETLRFIRVNEGARNNLGYSMDELRDLTPVDIKPQHTLESFLPLIDPLRSGARESLKFETVHQRKDGSVYPVEIHLQYMELDDTPVFAAIVLDITERHQAAAVLAESQSLLEQNVLERTASLRDSEERYRELFEHAGDLIQSMNPDGSFGYVNPAWLKTLGYLSGEVDSLTMFDIIHPDDLQHCHAVFGRTWGASLPKTSRLDS